MSAGSREQRDAAAPPRRALDVVGALPVLVPVALAVLTLVSVVLLLAHAFVLPLVLLVAVPATALVLRAVWPWAVAAGTGCGWDVVALVGTGLWGVVNALLSGQDVYATRDPGVYAVTARWLVDHDDLDLALYYDVFPHSQFVVTSSGFGALPADDRAVSQGMHGLPALIALPAKVFGDGALLHVNALFGAAALLAVYGFARLLVPARWAALVLLLMAATLPQAAFSRDPYTEPLSELFLFGGLGLLWLVRRAGPGSHAVAGLVLGASCLVRIDAFLLLPPLIGYLLLELSFAEEGRRRRRALSALAVLGGTLVPLVVGVRDLQRYSPFYLDAFDRELAAIGLMGVAAGLLGVVLVALAWRTRLLDPLGWRRRDAGPLLAGLAAVAVLLLAVALASRPLWSVGRGGPNSTVAQVQRTQGVPVDATRTFAEDSVTWLTWYLGIPTVVLGALGLALLVHRAVRGRGGAAGAFLLVFGVTALLYLVRPSNTPDQVWVVRRLLPLVLPGVAVAAAVLLAAVAERLPHRRVPVLHALAAVVLVLPVAFGSARLWPERQLLPQLAEAQDVCDALPEDAAVVLTGTIGATYQQTLRSYCEVPAVGYPGDDPAQLVRASVTAAAEGRRLFLLADAADDAAALSAAGSPPVPFRRTLVRTWEQLLDGPPRHEVVRERTLYLGPVGPDGRVATWASTR